MEGTDWLSCPPPKEVTHLVESTLVELREMQSLAGHVLPGEPVRSLLPQGPFPAFSAAMQLVHQRSRQADAEMLAATPIRAYSAPPSAPSTPAAVLFAKKLPSTNKPQLPDS